MRSNYILVCANRVKTSSPTKEWIGEVGVQKGRSRSVFREKEWIRRGEGVVGAELHLPLAVHSMKQASEITSLAAELLPGALHVLGAL